MIYEFAFEPELVATWHERRVAYPFVSAMGRGQPRVACAFPFPAWQKQVFGALDAQFPEGKNAKWQSAHKRIEILLKHLRETGSSRQARADPQVAWLTAAEKEHAEFPFRGIVVRSGERSKNHLVIASEFGEVECPVWDCDPPPVTRQAVELANALVPVLRCATDLRFVDPFFDAGVVDFFEPMRLFIEAAQVRRNPKELRLSIHVALTRPQLERAQNADASVKTLEDLAAKRFQTCRDKLKPLLREGVNLRFFGWAEATEQLHNRYLLSNVGGVMLGAGLDANGRIRTATDDLTLLSGAQWAVRWSQYSPGSSKLKCLFDRLLV